MEVTENMKKETERNLEEERNTNRTKLIGKQIGNSVKQERWF
jgi:hypothetical protein